MVSVLYYNSEFECLVIITDDTRLVSGDNIKRLSLVRDELSKEKKKKSGIPLWTAGPMRWF